MVVDTNFLLSHLRWLGTLLLALSETARIVIPWIVLVELDGLKVCSHKIMALMARKQTVHWDFMRVKRRVGSTIDSWNGIRVFLASNSRLRPSVPPYVR
jgi:predicted ribonuclease YlaK